jgi:hypothetical protein
LVSNNADVAFQFNRSKHGLGETLQTAVVGGVTGTRVNLSYIDDNSVAREGSIFLAGVAIGAVDASDSIF